MESQFNRTIALWTAVGFIAGTTIGVFLDNLFSGIGLGITAGLLLGFLFSVLKK